VAVAAPSQFTADADKESLLRVVACGEAFERGIGTEFRERCEKWYSQYRSFSNWRAAYLQASPPDRDTGLREAKRTWGAQLHIPLSFRTIETLVPAAIAQRPRMLVIPRKQAWAENVPNVRLLIDYQQDQIDIDLPFQAVMRSGRIYGLGVGKILWREEWANRRQARPHPFAGKLVRDGYKARFEPKYIPTRQRVKVFDDPDFEDVDIFDFMWDPRGYDLRSCGWVLHRTWRDIDYCLQMMRSGTWNSDSVKALLRDGREEEHLRAMGGRAKYDEVWQNRMEASGFTQANITDRGEQIHEVWEWHDGEQFHTVLDRSLYVLGDENPCCGEKPFVIHRPTPLQKQLIGIGDLEPLEHLQRELDTTRSQHCDAMTMALAPGWAYDGAAIDEEDLVFAPNMAIEVRNSDPGRALMPLQKPDVPSSTFKHVEMIRADMDDVGGVTEALNPGSGGTAGTATEAFLVQASLSRRIQLGSRRFEIEVVRRAAKQFLYLDQRMILNNREMLIPEEGMTFEQAAEAGAWRKFDVGPAGLMGDFHFRLDGGMAARNVPQDRQDAQLFFGLAASNPHVDPRLATLRGLELAGVDDPAGWLKKQEPPVPPAVMDMLKQMGVDPRLIDLAVNQAMQQDPQLPEQGGPNGQQVDQAMQPQPMEAPA
jgi:hypothetical protein